MDGVACSEFCYHFERGPVVQQVDVPLDVRNRVVVGGVHPHYRRGRHLRWRVEYPLEFVYVGPVYSLALRGYQSVVLGDEDGVD